MENRSREHGRILVLAEREGRGYASIIFELIKIGRKIANELSAILSGALLGHEISDVSREIALFADEIFCLDHSLLTTFQAELYTNTLENLCKNVNPDVVVMGHTLNNLSLAPRIGY